MKNLIFLILLTSNYSQARGPSGGAMIIEYSSDYSSIEVPSLKCKFIKPDVCRSTALECLGGYDLEYKGTALGRSFIRAKVGEDYFERQQCVEDLKLVEKAILLARENEE